MLHHGGVDRRRGACLEGRPIEPQEVKIAIASRHRTYAPRKDLGAVGLNLLGQHVGARHEDAAVPIVVAFGEEGLRTLAIGLLAELRHRENTAPQCVATLDVAVSSLRRARRDAEGDDVAALAWAAPAKTACLKPSAS